MIYKFKLVSNEVSNFVREIEIDSDSTFFQLRNAVLESVGYSKDDLDSFFLCDDDWERQEEITQEDMGISSSDKDIWVMDETPVGELVEDEGQKLVFVYNYITDQAFYMELKEMIPGRHLKDAVCTFKKGTAPPQRMDIDEFERKVDLSAQKKADDLVFEDLYGDSQFNEDELESGFEGIDDDSL